MCGLPLWHPYRLKSDDVVMDRAVGTPRRVRRWRSVAEKRQIVKLTLEPDASVALVARAHELNANHVFNWRRSFELSELVDFAAASIALLPVNGLGQRSEQPGCGDPGSHCGAGAGPCRPSRRGRRGQAPVRLRIPRGGKRSPGSCLSRSRI